MQRNPLRSPLLLQLAVALPVALSAVPALAHIDVDMGGTHMSRVSGGYDIKEGPCGVADAPRGMNVYKYRPGATITLKVHENIPHPGYFRISFDNDGDDSFVIPSGTSGEHGDCANDPKCGPGKEDFCSNDTVLIDNLDLHPGGGAAKTYTWSVTLPNVECTNCTLQIIQMMNDLGIHFQPYPVDDIYYHCIELELSNDAPESTDTPVENKGMNCQSDTSAGAAGAESAAGAGGSSGTAGAGGASTAGTGGSPAATGGSSAEPAAAAGSAAPASGGSAGAKAASGGAAAPSTSSGAAGAKAPATGSTSSPQGAAGKPAATSTSSGSAGSTAAAEPDGAADGTTEESGGCQAAGGGAGGLFAPAMLGLLTLGLRSYRRRRAA